MIDAAGSRPVPITVPTPALSDNHDAHAHGRLSGCLRVCRSEKKPTMNKKSAMKRASIPKSEKK
jgi:hypothetical protein